MTEDRPQGTMRLAFDAESDNIVVARQVAATMGARAQFTVEQTEDARLVMDEAVTLLIEAGATRIVCDFTIDGATLQMAAIGDAHTEKHPNVFAWTIIHALCQDVFVDHPDETTRIQVRMRARQLA